MPRDVLDARIEARVDAMWAAGLVDEVRRLEAAGCARAAPPAGRSATRRCCAHLAGECTEQEARDETVRATRRFARRQDGVVPARTRGSRWLPYDADDLVDRAVAAVAGVRVG